MEYTTVFRVNFRRTLRANNLMML